MVKYTSQLLENVFTNHITAKVFSVYTFAVIGYFFDLNKKEALVSLFILIIFDFIFGIASARVNKIPITSSKIRRTAIKLAVYFMLISASFLAEKSISFLPIDETVLAFLVLTELISIIENAGHCGFAVPKKLLAQLQEYRDAR